MKVFLKNDIVRVGMAGEIITVEDGYARNYLFPRGLGIEITPHNENLYRAKQKKTDARKEVIATKTSMLADRIGALKITIKKKMHDNGKLYGSLSAPEIVDELAKQGIAITKNQVIFDTAIKTRGVFNVTIKLTTRLQPQLAVTVISL